MEEIERSSEVGAGDLGDKAAISDVGRRERKSLMLGTKWDNKKRR